MAISLEKMLSSDRIPTLPAIALDIVESAQQEEPDFAQITQQIQADGAIASRILRTVNSALFGLRRRVSSIEEAIPILGSNLVRTLVLSFTLADQQRRVCNRFPQHHQRIWRSSVTQAVAAETLGLDYADVDESVWFLGGLLQDIGRLAMLSDAPEVYDKLLEDPASVQKILRSERALFGFDHVTAAKQMALRWRIDNVMVDAISKHHGRVVDTQNGQSMPKDPTQVWLPNALRCAQFCDTYLDALRHRYEFADRGPLEKALAAGFGIDQSDGVHEFLTNVDIRVNEVSVLFSIDIGEDIPLEPLLARAQSSLAQIAISSQLQVSVAEKAMDEALRSAIAVQDKVNESRRDGLTGAQSRSALNSIIQSNMKQASELGGHVGILFVDTDNFKRINDGHGHQMGDLVLQRLATELERAASDRGAVVRYGGDEFVVVVTQPSGQDLLTTGDVMLSGIRSIDLSDAGADLQVACSIGLVAFDPAENLPMPESDLLHAADLAMYEAKKNGGDQLVASRVRGGEVIEWESSGRS